MGAVEAIQLCFVHLSLALAGLWGTTLFRIPIPWGKGAPISSYWLLRAVCLILLGVLIRESLVFMNGGDLMDIVRPFLITGAGRVTDRGSGGGQPSDSFILLPFSQESHSRDRDAGSSGWGAPSPIQELPPLEGEHGQPTEVGVDLEAEPSNGGRREAAAESGLKRISSWRTKGEIAQARAIEEIKRDRIFGLRNRIVERLVKIKKKDRGVRFPVGKKKWEEVTETLLRGESPEIWREKLKELDEQWVDGPFYQSLRDLLLSEWNKKKKRR